MMRSSTIIITKVIIQHRITINTQNNTGPIQQMDTTGTTSINIKITPMFRGQMITATRRHARTLAVTGEVVEEAEEIEAVAVEKEYHKPCHQWM